MNMKAVIVYSGGMDSYTLLHYVRSLGYTVYALSFDYGQRHSKELDYAAIECNRMCVPHIITDISGVNQLLQGSSLTADMDVPEGHYEEESMKQTVVPNRNMIMLSLATAYAVSIGAHDVFFGAHAGDHAIYPDCRPEFVASMNETIAAANYQLVNIHGPFLTKDKGDIALIGASMNLDYGRAWTCYNGREKACGKCGACQERLEAMAKAGIIDPMEYES